VEKQSGGLLFTNGTPESSYGIDAGMQQKYMIAEIGEGESQVAGIWGATQEEASQTLADLQGMRRKLN